MNYCAAVMHVQKLEIHQKIMNKILRKIKLIRKRELLHRKKNKGGKKSRIGLTVLANELLKDTFINVNSKSK